MIGGGGATLSTWHFWSNWFSIYFRS